MSQTKHKKKSQVPPDEKLWRRISTKFGTNEKLWDNLWDSEKIYSFIVEKEKLKLDNKESKQLKSKIDEILAHSKKGRQWFLYQEKSNFTLRKPNEINEIEASIRHWRNFFNTYSPTEEIPLTGQLPDEESKRYRLIEDVWFAIISNEKLPEEFSLSESEYILKWKAYDLIKDATDSYKDGENNAAMAAPDWEYMEFENTGKQAALTGDIYGVTGPGIFCNKHDDCDGAKISQFYMAENSDTGDWGYAAEGFRTTDGDYLEVVNTL